MMSRQPLCQVRQRLPVVWICPGFSRRRRTVLYPMTRTGKYHQQLQTGVQHQWQLALTANNSFCVKLLLELFSGFCQLLTGEVMLLVKFSRNFGF